MRVGYAVSDITPGPGLTLSGFAARRNRPSVGVHDPISARALAVEDGGRLTLIVSFDLLAIGERLHRLLDAAVHAEFGRIFASINRVYCCTHTHSAPAAILLLGSGIEDEGYWSFLIERTREVCRRAVSSMAPARAAYAIERLPGRNVNRRIRLADGQVVMKAGTERETVTLGPTWETAFFVRFDRSDTGSPIAAFMHWAAHPTTAATQYISSDFPGLLRRMLTEREGIPFFYLQGAAGNLSVPTEGMTFEDTKRAAESVMADLPRLHWVELQGPPGMEFVRDEVALAYGPVQEEEDLALIEERMDHLSRFGSGDADSIAELSNILNVKRGEEPDPEMLKHIASILRDWAKMTRRGRRSRPKDCALQLSVVRLGKIALAFVAAEVFVETAHALQKAFPDSIVQIAAYASPLVGYLPTDNALVEGGYEPNYAYRFYGHPAPFAAGSEERLISSVKKAVRHLMRTA